MFLYASLVLKDIELMDDIGEIREYLKVLPEDLDGVCVFPICIALVTVNQLTLVQGMRECWPGLRNSVHIFATKLGQYLAGWAARRRP